MRNRIIQVIAIAAIALGTIAGPATAKCDCSSGWNGGGGADTHASSWR